MSWKKNSPVLKILSNKWRILRNNDSKQTTHIWCGVLISLSLINDIVFVYFHRYIIQLSTKKDKEAGLISSLKTAVWWKGTLNKQQREGCNCIRMLLAVIQDISPHKDNSLDLCTILALSKNNLVLFEWKQLEFVTFINSRLIHISLLHVTWLK